MNQTYFYKDNLKFNLARYHVDTINLKFVLILLNSSKIFKSYDQDKAETKLNNLRFRLIRTTKDWIVLT